MAKQTEMEILLSKFRNNIKDSKICVVEMLPNQQIGMVKQVKYFSDGEYDLIVKEAQKNYLSFYEQENTIKEQERLAKLALEQQRYDELELRYTKQKELNLVLLDTFKVLFGESNVEYKELLAKIESMVK